MTSSTSVYVNAENDFNFKSDEIISSENNTFTANTHYSMLMMEFEHMKGGGLLPPLHEI